MTYPIFFFFQCWTEIATMTLISMHQHCGDQVLGPEIVTGTGIVKILTLVSVLTDSAYGPGALTVLFLRKE